MAYCTADEVNIRLGSSLSREAEDAAESVIEGVSSFIDLYTGQSWAGGTVPDEVQTVRGGQVALTRTPVLTIGALSVIEPSIGAVPTALVAGVGYQLINPTSGLVLVSAADGWIATATYTVEPSAVPPHINLAASILSAHCIRYAIDPTGFTLSKVESGEDRLTYVGGDSSGSGAGPGAGLPALFETLLRGSSGSGQNWFFA